MPPQVPDLLDTNVFVHLIRNDAVGQYLKQAWLPKERKSTYPNLLAACRPFPKPMVEKAPTSSDEFDARDASTFVVMTAAFSPDRMRALSGGGDTTVRLWDVETGQCLHVLKGHTDCVRSVAWSADGRCAFSVDSIGGFRE